MTPLFKRKVWSLQSAENLRSVLRFTNLRMTSASSKMGFVQAISLKHQ